MGYEHPLPDDTSSDPALAEDFNSWIPVSVPPAAARDGTPYSATYFPEHSGGQYRGALIVASRQPELNLWNVLSGVLAILSGNSRTQDGLVDTGRFQEWPTSPPGHAQGSGAGAGAGSGGGVKGLYEEADGLAVSGAAFYAADEGARVTDFYAKDVDKAWRGGHCPSAPPMFTSSDADVKAVMEVLEAEPPQWLPDSSASACMQCGSLFRALMCGRHHCRFCGGIFCRSCTTGRCLLPVKFRERNPQRICDACYQRLEPVQRNLTDRVSNASQLATYDVTDMTCMRGWLNSPCGLSMEHEIYKATNTIRSYCKIGTLKQERMIPDAVLKGAQGLAIVTVVKAGVVLTYKIGTGLVVGRRSDGSWSAPSAIATCGLGWGCQAGGELTDFIIVLRTKRALKAFCGRLHFSLGAGLSAAVGPVGRVAEADIRASANGTAACYTYSCSKGAFVGVSLEGNIVATRADTNMCFYGDPHITSTKLLFGRTARPRAAAPLYIALNDLFGKIDQKRFLG